MSTIDKPGFGGPLAFGNALSFGGTDFSSITNNEVARSAQTQPQTVAAPVQQPQLQAGGIPPFVPNGVPTGTAAELKKLFNA